MASGIFIWSLTTLLGSFMNNFWMFLVMRSFVGIGEASYSTIAPTIISDMFIGDMRSKMLALFYFAIPVGRYRSFPPSLKLFETLWLFYTRSLHIYLLQFRRDLDQSRVIYWPMIIDSIRTATRQNGSKDRKLVSIQKELFKNCAQKLKIAKRMSEEAISSRFQHKIQILFVS